MLRVTVSLLVLAGVLTSCGDGSEPAAPPATTSTTPTTSTPTSAPSSAPATTPGPTKARDAATLKKALLEQADLPSPFKVAPAPGDDDTTFTSKDARCARLVALMNTEKVPGGRASVSGTYKGSDQGPFIEETLDAMASADAVQTFHRSYRAAVKSCSKVTARIAGEGSSTLRVTEVSAPKVGQGPFAIRVNATSGPMKGVQMELVGTGVDDVLLGILFVAASPQVVKAASEAAVAKAEKVLGT